MKMEHGIRRAFGTMLENEVKSVLMDEGVCVENEGRVGVEAAVGCEDGCGRGVPALIFFSARFPA